MVRTRAQDRRDSLAGKTTLQSSPASKGSSTKRARPASNATAEHKEGGPKTKKRKPNKNNQQSGVKNNQAASIDLEIQKLLDKHGEWPLANSGLTGPHQPNAKTILAHVFNALLSSTRISHQIAAKSVQCVLDAGYADLSKLEASTWHERTEVLTEGGYTHYRERTATQLGDLAKLTREKYNGNLKKHA